MEPRKLTVRRSPPLTAEEIRHADRHIEHAVMEIRGTEAPLPEESLEEMLAELFAPEIVELWLNAPHPRFGGRSPAQAVRDGDGDLVRLAVSNALEGHPD